MGKIQKTFVMQIVKPPMLNNRFCVDLSENVHLHYRNLRLEFSPQEFIAVLAKLQCLHENDVDDFFYSPASYKEILHDESLPDAPPFSDRLRIERQIEGHWHLHYRNLRIEVESLAELGLALRVRLSQLRVTVLTENGWRNTEIKECPFYRSLAENSVSIYDAYLSRLSHKRPEDKIISFVEFCSLADSIRKGYDPTRPILFEAHRLTIKDGHHRASALLWLHGDCEVEIFRDEIVAVRVRKLAAPSSPNISIKKPFLAVES